MRIRLSTRSAIGIISGLAGACKQQGTCCISLSALNDLRFERCKYWELSYAEQRCSGMQAAAPKKAAAPKAKKAITKKVCSTACSGTRMYASQAGGLFIYNCLHMYLSMSIINAVTIAV